MHALKGIVVFMGLIIVTLMILIVYGMIQKAQDPNFSFFSGNESGQTLKQAPANLSNKADINKIMLGLPQGSTIEGTDMGADTMAVRVNTDGKDGADTIILIDIKSGNIISIVRIGAGIEP